VIQILPTDKLNIKEVCYRCYNIASFAYSVSYCHRGRDLFFWKC